MESKAVGVIQQPAAVDSEESLRNGILERYITEDTGIILCWEDAINPAMPANQILVHSLLQALIHCLLWSLVVSDAG